MPNDDLMHYGILRKSGRYPWGSGKDEYTRSMQFYQLTDAMKQQGLSEVDIAQGVGMSVSELRSTRTIAKEQIVLEQTNRAVALRDKGVSINEIARRLEMEPPTVRLRLKNSENVKKTSLRETAEVIRKNVDEHGIVDIGKGVEYQLGIKGTRLKAAVAVLRDEGYETYTLKVKNVGTAHDTNQLVIVKPGTTWGEANKMRDKIHTMGEHSIDDGLTYFGLHPPMSISSKRLKVVFDEDGGSAQDGVVHVRPGVPDLDMGKNTLTQARIAIDGTHFIKGMALQNPDMPPGVDLVFHTNKSREVGKLGALKPLKDDKDNPFGSIIKRQLVDIDPKTGKERLKSAINIVNEEGDWDGWRNSVPSQMLAKQPHALIKSQLAVTREETKSRLAEIEKITNPVVKQKRLQDFADQVDADAVDLRAAAMPRQATKVIMPMPKMNPNEIYAPTFETGEKVVLIRYPHGGRFEIPEVTVNNNNRTAKKLLGNATDAIGLHPKVAERLSGADFDGDTVVVISNRSGKIKGSKSMGHSAKIYEDGLKDFDPKRKYGGYEVIKPQVGEKGKPGYKAEVGNFPLMKNTGKEMGMVTNLITDMQIQGARPEHVIRAVKHSMVVIDAEKHKLNYKQSEIDNGIGQLKTLYQGGPKSGATTLLSRATAKVRQPELELRKAQDGGPIDPQTGAKVYVPTGRLTSKYDPKTQTYLPEKVLAEKKYKRLEMEPDAFNLVRDRNNPVEQLYAEHANSMKAIANETRLRAARIESPKQNRAAKEVYRDEVADLDRQLETVRKQLPLQRKANVISSAVVKAKRQEDPLLRTDLDRLKRVERQAKQEALRRLGLKQPEIKISDRQWDAIQSGAVSASKLREMLKHVDTKRIDDLAMPKSNPVMTTAIAQRAKAMLAAGATTADVARSLGVSASTLKAAQSRGDV